MKVALSLASLASLALLFASCQKDLSRKETTLTAATVSSNALYPLPCHSLSFTTDYPVKPGEVPPFRFTKTLYPDTRVKTINMLSRVFPIYSGYKKQAVELNGNFSYSTNRGYLKGTSEVWEYYKTPTGAGARKSVSRGSINLKFYFDSVTGFCWRVTDLDIKNNPSPEEWAEHSVLEINYGSGFTDAIALINVPNAGGTGLPAFYYATLDKYGNIVDWNFPYGGSNYASRTTYSYDYTKPRGTKNYSFIPSQNLFTQEFSLLEVMQWVPQPKHQRTGVAGVFFLADGTKITQSQIYRNYQFDSKGNEISVTYGDNVPQRTTWYCK